jgi:MFS transporter, YNFM family, putative membrane transport protein
MQLENVENTSRSSALPSRTPPVQQAVIGTMAFLTVVDLFATQALLPTLAAHYEVKPSAIGLAVNACTLGMASAAASTRAEE